MSVAPFGSWPTPITSELVVRAASRPGDPVFDRAGDGPPGSATPLWWAETRPQEAGRTTVLRDGREVLAEPWNARTAAHEYGGGAWWVGGGVLYFANWTDQRLYRVTGDGDGWAEPQPITAAPDRPRAVRWADGDIHPNGHSIVVVRETHPADGSPADVRNELVILQPAADGSPVCTESVVVSGPDFVSDPRWSPDGRWLCWVEWDHPNMPWDGSRLMLRRMADPAGTDAAGDDVAVAGAVDESVSQPQWDRHGRLWFLSDRSGWWNLYRCSVDDPPGPDRGPAGAVVEEAVEAAVEAAVETVVEVDGDICHPQWVFSERRYRVLDDGRVVMAVRAGGDDRLAVWDGAQLVDIAIAHGTYDSVDACGNDVVAVAATPTSEEQILRISLVDSGAGDVAHPARVEVIRPARQLGIDPAWFSEPQPISFPSADGRTAHALYYPPTSPTHQGPAGQRPPLLVTIHGGPTSAARPRLEMGRQYWTSRGFAVVDVNYGGSSGYGRAYRQLLNGAWGVLDVQDCAAAARFLADAGLVDPQRLCIRGGSAGGFTTLAALAFGDTFAAGASHFGVADLEALATDTHKFESRYLDGLIGPYPEQRQTYRDRSPIHHVDGFDRPLIVLQGLEDEVVPPAQSEMIVDALQSKGVPVAYVPFAGEQHGFRQAANIRRALDAELSFYAQVLGFEIPAAEGIEPVELR